MNRKILLHVINFYPSIPTTYSPPSLIRVFAVRTKEVWVLSYPLSTQRRLWSDWSDAQADVSLCWAHMLFCWFCHEVAHISFSKWHIVYTYDFAFSILSTSTITAWSFMLIAESMAVWRKKDRYLTKFLQDSKLSLHISTQFSLALT